MTWNIQEKQFKLFQNIDMRYSAVDKSITSYQPSIAAFQWWHTILKADNQQTTIISRQLQHRHGKECRMKSLSIWWDPRIPDFGEFFNLLRIFIKVLQTMVQTAFSDCMRWRYWGHGEGFVLWVLLVVLLLNLKRLTRVPTCRDLHTSAILFVTHLWPRDTQAHKENMRKL